MATSDIIVGQVVATFLIIDKIEEKTFSLSIKDKVKEVKRPNFDEAVWRTGGNKTEYAKLFEISYRNCWCGLA
jgi:hypothetical protein